MAQSSSPSRAKARKQHATPHRDEPQNAARHHIETRNQKSAGLQIRKRLPFKRRKSAVSADKANRNQESPLGANPRSFAQQRKKETENQASRDVDNESAIGKPGAHAVCNRRADPIADKGTQR